jgi:hypothetical protein
MATVTRRQEVIEKLRVSFRFVLLLVPRPRSRRVGLFEPGDRRTRARTREGWLALFRQALTPAE